VERTNPREHSSTFYSHVTSWHQTQQDDGQAQYVLNRLSVTTIYEKIDSGKTLPNPNSKEIPLTAEEANLIGELSKEFGGTISRDVLRYLVRWLGASKFTAARIRCLYQKDYLWLPSSVYTSLVLESKYESALNAVVNHLNPNDLEGAWKDANPSEVDPKTIKDPGYVSGAKHAKEVDGGIKAIKKVLTSLDKRIGDLNRRMSHAPDPNTPSVLGMLEQKVHLQKLKNVFVRLQDFVQAKIAKGSPSPNTWPDQGQVPTIEDLLQVSACKVPDAQYYH
jgi:hypothetical protein